MEWALAAAAAGAATSALLAARWLRDRRALLRQLDASRRRLQQLPVADELTGLGNAVRLMDDLAAHIARGRRYGHGFALMLFVPDGPATQDELLMTARVLEDTARGADRCYCLGDHFAAVLPEQGATGAVVAAERARTGLQLAGTRTCSIGVVAWVPWEDDEPPELLRRAGALAATSAQRGGDRITVAEPSKP